MEKDKSTKNAQEAYLELQMLGQRIKQSQQQMQAIEEQVAELELTVESFDDLKNTEKGTEILVPLSSGIFTKASLVDNKELIVNVGAGTAVKKSIDDTKQLLSEQVNNLREFQRQATANIEALGARAAFLENEINELAVEEVG